MIFILRCLGSNIRQLQSQVLNSLNFYVYQNALNCKSHYGCPIFQKAFLSKFVIKFLEKKSTLYLSFSLHCFSLTLFYHICCLLALISTSEIWILLFSPATIFPGEFSYPPSLCTPGQIQPSFTSKTMATVSELDLYVGRGRKPPGRIAPWG